MRIKLVSTVIIAISLMSCNPNKKEKETVSKPVVENNEARQEAINIQDSKGYALMQQKCFICHLEKPDPSKRGAMLAPPMSRVQEHYKPAYLSKAAFVEAVTVWVKNPVEDKTLMPGAVRKFNVMPKLPYEDADIKLIAETLYAIDFGNMPKMNRGQHSKLQLNDGKKWKLNTNTISNIGEVSGLLEKFQSSDLKAYQKLGRDVFDKAKTILLDKSYDENIFNQLHGFFNGVETNMHMLIGAQSIEEAKNQHKILKKKFAEFNDFFE